MFCRSWLSSPDKSFMKHSVGLPAHDMVFIFFTFWEESSNLQSSTVLKIQSSSSTNVAIHNLHSSASQIFFILQCRLEQIFIFVFMLKLPTFKSSRKPAGSPIQWTPCWSSDPQVKDVWMREEQVNSKCNWSETQVTLGCPVSARRQQNANRTVF